MCGRFSLAYQKTDREYDEYFKKTMQGIKKAKPRYHIAPTQKATVIRFSDGDPVLEELKWGLWENWWKEKLGMKRPLWNARSEKVFSSGLYKRLAKTHRCLVPATGWFEWKKIPGHETGDPYNFCMKDHSVMLFAGLWTTRYLDKDVGEDNFSIITTDPTPMAAKFHDRMPVILTSTQAKAWLDPEYKNLEKLESFLAPYKGRNLTSYQVGPTVNSVKNIGPDCLEPAAA